MHIEYFNDPKWANQDNTAIDVIVKFAGFSQAVPFTATRFEPGTATILFDRAISGEAGPIADYIAPVQQVVVGEPTPNPSNTLAFEDQ